MDFGVAKHSLGIMTRARLPLISTGTETSDLGVLNLVGAANAAS